jgi:hypothetical protein
MNNQRSFSITFCRFVLPPIGILDTGSAISFVLTQGG